MYSLRREFQIVTWDSSGMKAQAIIFFISVELVSLNGNYTSKAHLVKAAIYMLHLLMQDTSMPI